MKLKDYEIPQYGLDQEDLAQYSLKNFDLKALQQTQQQPDLEPIAAPYDPSLLQQQIASPSPVALAPQPNPWSPAPEQSNEQSFSPAPNPVQPELSPPALDSYEVQFGAHFNLQTVSYVPLSPAQSWKIPRWVVMTVGLFFGSAAALTLAFCVVLLRGDPKPAPTEPLAVPAAPVAAAPAPPARPAASVAVSRVPAAVARAASAPVMHADAAPVRRVVVSRHPSVVRRQVYGPRHVASKSATSSLEPQETETASRRPPPDALDKLLSESSL